MRSETTDGRTAYPDTWRREARMKHAKPENVDGGSERDQMGQNRSTSFGDLLRDFRLAAGLSQEALAERARMSADGIGVLERGVRRAPYRGTVKLLAEGLALSASDSARLEEAALRSPRPRRRPTKHDGIALAHNLPIELTSFIGRDEEVAELRKLLESTRLVTIVGAGGVGKTRTALRVAQTLVGSVAGGVWFVDLAPLADASFLVATIARTFGLPESPGGASLAALLLFLERKELLLLVDNCEHLVSEAAQLSEVVTRACERVRILATSREPLKAPGESVYRLPPLPASDATTLFVERAKAADQRFTLGEGNETTIRSICERLDRIPLAIELAAARSNALPLRTLAERLHQRFSVLTGGGRKALARHQTLRALIDWSYALLPPRAQRIFEQLSVFVGGTTLALAATICGEDTSDEVEVLDTLASLIEKSLVVPDFDHEEPRYTMLESTRQYARERLIARGEAETTARRHAHALCELAAEYEATWTTAPHPAWVDVLRAEMGNWQAVLEWTLLSRHDVALGLRLVGALHNAWVSVALAEGQRWLSVAQQCVDAQTPVSVVASLDYVAARIAQQKSESKRAVRFGESALKGFRQAGDVRQSLVAMRLIADSLLSLDQLSAAEPLLRDALETARPRGYRWLVAFLLQSMGRVSSLKGDLDEARAYYHSALALLRELGDQRGATSIAVNLAEAEFRAGDAAAALRLAEEVLSTPSRLGRLHIVLANAVAYLNALDRFDEALADGRELLRSARHDQQHVLLAWALQHVMAAVVLRGGSAGATRCRDYARVLGFVDARVAALGAPRGHTEQQEYDRVRKRLRVLLAPDEVERELAAGAAMSEERAVEIAEASAEP
jgi:predicted ATPase